MPKASCVVQLATRVSGDTMSGKASRFYGDDLEIVNRQSSIGIALLDILGSRPAQCFAQRRMRCREAYFAQFAVVEMDLAAPEITHFEYAACQW